MQNKNGKAKNRRGAFSLLELMVVVLLIGIFSAVIAVNVRQSIEKGRFFKTDQAIAQIEDILLLEFASGNYPSLSEMIASQESMESILASSGLTKDPRKLLKDGWGKNFVVFIDPADGSLRVNSESIPYIEYINKKNGKSANSH